MNETIILSPEAFEKLKQELMKTGPIQIGHGSIQSFLGMPIVISKHIPPGQVFMVSDPARPFEMPIEMTVTLPKISVAQARMLTPYCDVSLWDEARKLSYVLSVRQGDRELGRLSIHYEDLLASQRLPASFRNTVINGRIDKSEVLKFLQCVPGPNEWWEAVETS